MGRMESQNAACSMPSIRNGFRASGGNIRGMSHDGQGRVAELSAIDTWFSQQILYLLQTLDGIPEGTGTLLDNTLVVVGRELGSTAHRMERVPFIVAGKTGGKLVTQRFLNYSGQQHVRLLVSIAQLMGVETNSIGNRVQNSGGGLTVSSRQSRVCPGESPRH